MIIVNYIALILLIIGGINWGLIGIFDFNLVKWICKLDWLVRVVYVLVLLSAIWLIIAAIIDGGILLMP